MTLRWSVILAVGLLAGAVVVHGGLYQLTPTTRPTVTYRLNRLTGTVSLCGEGVVAHAPAEPGTLRATLEVAVDMIRGPRPAVQVECSP